MQFTREQLVSFGNYLLSEERAKMASELNQEFVTHADVENWMEGLVEVEPDTRIQAFARLNYEINGARPHLPEDVYENLVTSLDNLADEVWPNNVKQ